SPTLMPHHTPTSPLFPYTTLFRSFFSFVGRGGSNAGIISLRLVPKSERKMTIDQIMDHLRPQLSAIPGLRVSLQNPPPIRLGGRDRKSTRLNSSHQIISYAVFCLK